jgi:hypothetical protein
VSNGHQQKQEHATDALIPDTQLKRKATTKLGDRDCGLQAKEYKHPDKYKYIEVTKDQT